MSRNFLPTCRSADLPTCRLADLPTCRPAEITARQEPRPPVSRKTSVLESEHPCEPKFFRSGGRTSGEPKIFCRPPDLPICRFADLPTCRNHGSAGASPSSETKISVVQEHDPSVKRIFCRSDFSRNEYAINLLRDWKGMPYIVV